MDGVGARVGDSVGATVGDPVGANVGDKDGAAVVGAPVVGARQSERWHSSVKQTSR